MSLAAGDRLGPYEVVSLLGAGGMGEVYRARDLTLNRHVALKVLPDSVAGDADRLARFRREAEALAALNHPNIGQIYGLDQSSSTPALVLELVEGPTLAERIATGPLPIDEALRIARQIAEALEAAHDRGIIHRDLKPANVKAPADGVVKVLDFGLAKILSPTPDLDTDVANSPTLTARATQLGVVLGTAAYMAPEQAKGRAVDKRADVWAFGVVLYEMLAGRRVFDGDDATEVLADVIRGTPHLAALPAGTPASIRRLLRRCLERDRASRLDSMRAARLEIDDGLAGTIDDVGPAHAAAGAQGPAGRWWLRPVPLLVIGLSALAGAAVTGLVFRQHPAAARDVARYEMGLAAGASLSGLSLTPDGRSVVYAAAVRSTESPAVMLRLYRRDLGRLESEPIPGSDGADGALVIWTTAADTWIAYRANRNEVRKIRLSGGTFVSLVKEASLPQIWGITRDASDHLIFGLHDGGLRRVSTAGGAVEVFTKVEGSAPHRFPHVLPDGHGVVFTIVGGGAGDQVAVLPAGATEPKVLTRGVGPQYTSSGHLLFHRERSLWAAPFDLARLELTAEPVPVLDVDVSGYQVSGDGSLYYASRSLAARSRLTWIDPRGQGREAPLPVPPSPLARFWLSPNEQTLLAREGTRLWLYDLKTGAKERLTNEDVTEWNGTWSIDGRHVIYMSRRTGPFLLYRTNVAGTRTIEPLGQAGGHPVGWMGDGTRLISRVTGALHTWDTMTQVSQLLVRDESLLVGDAECVASPDGRFVACEVASNPPAISIRPLDKPDANRWLIPLTADARGLRWSRDGRTLFYRSGAAVMAVPIARGGDSPIGVPVRVFEDVYGPGLEVAKDGRFLMTKSVDPASSDDRIVVVRNWLQELTAAVRR